MCSLVFFINGFYKSSILLFFSHITPYPVDLVSVSLYMLSKSCLSLTKYLTWNINVFYKCCILSFLFHLPTALPLPYLVSPYPCTCWPSPVYPLPNTSPEIFMGSTSAALSYFWLIPSLGHSTPYLVSLYPLNKSCFSLTKQLTLNINVFYKCCLLLFYPILSLQYSLPTTLCPCITIPSLTPSSPLPNI